MRETGPASTLGILQIPIQTILYRSFQIGWHVYERESRQTKGIKKVRRFRPWPMECCSFNVAAQATIWLLQSLSNETNSKAFLKKMPSDIAIYSNTKTGLGMLTLANSEIFFMALI